MENMMFSALESIRDFERKFLPFLNNLESREILLAVGMAEESGRPTTMKQLMHQLDSLSLGDIKKTSTIRRRIEELIELGIIETKKANHDARFLYLHLSEKAKKLFSEYLKVIFSAKGIHLKCKFSIKKYEE